MKPPCYNRPAFTDPNAGWRDTGMMRVNVGRAFRDPLFKPIYRYRWPWFEDRCTQHDGTGIAGPGSPHASFAVAMAFDCDGCRHDPRVSA